MQNEIFTKKINNGAVALAAKTKKYGVQVVTYANDTQANTAAVLLQARGIDCYVWRAGVVRYIVIKSTPETAPGATFRMYDRNGKPCGVSVPAN